MVNDTFLKVVGTLINIAYEEAPQKYMRRNRMNEALMIDQFRYIKIQAKTIDLSTRLWGINPTNSGCILQSLVLRSIVLG